MNENRELCPFITARERARCTGEGIKHFNAYSLDSLAFGQRGNREELGKSCSGGRRKEKGRGISSGLHSVSFLVLCGVNCFLRSLGRGSKSKCNPACRAGA